MTKAQNTVTNVVQDRETKGEERTEDAYEWFDKNEGQKYTEKCGEDVWNAFTWPLCKTTEEQEIEVHLEMPDHKKTLKLIGKNIQFGKRAADFLHASKVKNKKIADRWQQQEQKEPAQKRMNDVWMGVDPDDQMKRVGVAQSAVQYSFPISLCATASEIE
ncbi:hypothetical protein scyTo_0006296 [Scyliorhinus torazame]|uniref:Uncharacterized protein n=1 Tax=Scyliorhinus torazame TaxID=75743 RepID=A0A401PH28_SCYTO|nr:hypothetical protein [Scyliorhinus torazame]